MSDDFPDRVDPEWACKHCDGRRFYTTLVGPLTIGSPQQRPCWFCNETGDRRNAPTEWKRCPSNRYRTDV